MTKMRCEDCKTYVIKYDIEYGCPNCGLVHSPILENKLPDSFMRIHRGTIVNRTRINEFDGSGVEVGGHYLPVSKTYRPTLIKILKT